MIETLTVIIGSGAIASLCTYIVSKRIVKNAIAEVKDEIFFSLQDEEMQKFLFSVGALIGQGVKSGIGLKARSGKFHWQDLIAQIIGQWVSQKTQPQQQFPPIEKPL